MKTLSVILAGMLSVFMINCVLAGDGDSTHVVKKIVKIIDNGKTIVDTTFVYSGDSPECMFMHNFARGADAMRGKMMPPQRGGAPMMMGRNSKMRNEFDMPMGSDSDSLHVFTMRVPDKIGKMKFGRNQEGQGHAMMMFNGENQGALPNIRGHQNDNKKLIDLNDPNIISFERETTKDGEEKITIIRKKQEEPQRPEKKEMKEKRK